MFIDENDDSANTYFNPSVIDQQIRNAVSMAWQFLPEGSKTKSDLEKQVGRLVERAVRDFFEDLASFRE